MGGTYIERGNVVPAVFRRDQGRGNIIIKPCKIRLVIGTLLERDGITEDIKIGRVTIRLAKRTVVQVFRRDIFSSTADIECNQNQRYNN